MLIEALMTAESDNEFVTGIHQASCGQAEYSINALHCYTFAFRISQGGTAINFEKDEAKLTVFVLVLYAER